jgi:hypothetical protein
MMKKTVSEIFGKRLQDNPGDQGMLPTGHPGGGLMTIRNMQ